MTGDVSELWRWFWCCCGRGLSFYLLIRNLAVGCGCAGDIGGSVLAVVALVILVMLVVWFLVPFGSGAVQVMSLTDLCYFTTVA